MYERKVSKMAVLPRGKTAPKQGLKTPRGKTTHG
jgi:hypothetical protein